MALDSGAAPLDQTRGPDDPCPANPARRVRDCYYCWHGERHPGGAQPPALKPTQVIDVKPAAPTMTPPGLCEVCRTTTTCNCAKCLAAKGGRLNTCGRCFRAAAAASKGGNQ
jgi:hypothetical protein